MNEVIADTMVTYLTMRKDSPMGHYVLAELEPKFRARSYKNKLLEKFERDSDAKPNQTDKQTLKKYILELLEEDEQFRQKMQSKFRMDPV